MKSGPGIFTSTAFKAIPYLHSQIIDEALSRCVGLISNMRGWDKIHQANKILKKQLKKLHLANKAHSTHNKAVES